MKNPSLTGMTASGLMAHMQSQSKNEEGHNSAKAAYGSYSAHAPQVTAAMERESAAHQKAKKDPMGPIKGRP